MPNNIDDSVIYYEKILKNHADEKSQVNFSSDAARKEIAEKIANEKMANNNIEKANKLLDQIIPAAEQEDEILKDYWIGQGKGERAIGDSFVVFHLRALKKLLNE